MSEEIPESPEASAAGAEAAAAEIEAEAAPADETAKTAGRGFLVITGAKLWFMVTGAVIQLGLPIFLGSAEQFGVFKIVTEAISLINMVVITGTLQAVSKLVSEQPAAANRVVDQALKLQLVLGIPIAAAYALLSPWIAGQFNDPSLTGLIRLSSAIIAFYAFYAVFVGYLNGIKSFVRQASLDITFATLKMVGIVGLVLLGFGVGGAVAGFVIASGIICVVAGVWTFKLMRAGAGGATDAETSEHAAAEAKQAARRLLGYLVLVMLYTFALNGLMRADLFILKSITAEVPAHLAAAEDIFQLISNKFAGFYGAVLNIARIPYQGVIAVTFVIFPLISEATFAEDLSRTQDYIRDTFRYCLLLIGGVGMLLAFNSDAIIAGLYSADYQTAAPALAILSVSIIFFALYYVATTMIIGAGQPTAAVVIMAASLLLSAGLNWWFVSEIHAEVVGQLTFEALASAPGDTAAAAVQNALSVSQNQTAFAGQYLVRGTDYMEAAATATAIAMFVGFLLSIGWLYKQYRALPPLGTSARLVLSALALWGVDVLFQLPTIWVAEMGKLAFLGLVVVKMAAMGVVFLVVLFALREFGAEDLRRVRAVIGR